MGIDMLLQPGFGGGDIGHVDGAADDAPVNQRHMGEGERAALAAHDGEALGFQRVAFGARRTGQIALGFVERSCRATRPASSSAPGRGQEGAIAPKSDSVLSRSHTGIGSASSTVWKSRDSDRLARCSSIQTAAMPPTARPRKARMRPSQSRAASQTACRCRSAHRCASTRQAHRARPGRNRAAIPRRHRSGAPGRRGPTPAEIHGRPRSAHRARRQRRATRTSRPRKVRRSFSVIRVPPAPTIAAAAANATAPTAIVVPAKPKPERRPSPSRACAGKEKRRQLLRRRKTL